MGYVDNRAKQILSMLDADDQIVVEEHIRDRIIKAGGREGVEIFTLVFICAAVALSCGFGLGGAVASSPDPAPVEAR